jgi:pimeloyl-ACP methyl ester carboxylesterase
MTLLTAPRLEGTIEVEAGRRLGFSEFERPRGRAVIWMHGTPGARRQVPEVARIAAEELDLRIVGIDRPGVGHSTPHRYGSMFDFTADLTHVLECLGIDEFAMLGLSGGGPYVLACAYALPDRMKVGGVLGGVAPTIGPDAPEGGVVALSARFARALGILHVPLSYTLMATAWTLRPLASPALRAYARLSPPGDRVVFARPEMRAMFLDDLLKGGERGIRAPVYDILLFGSDWGFSVQDITVPIRWWHGDADHIVPLEHGHHLVELIPDAEMYVRPGESHLGTLGAAEEILGVLLEAWDASARARPLAEHAPNRR